MADDLTALIERLRTMPPGTLLTVLIPRNGVQAMGGLLFQENDTYHIPASLFASPAPQPDPDTPNTRTMQAVRELNVRAAPERDSELLGQVKAGERVRVAIGAVNGYTALVDRSGFVLESGLIGG